ncbi:MAG TPA: hypothetical protein VKV95_05730 [Terriglobia bacterium]|nr:hypothetical protein [Terriglobia bacterium]
MEAGSSASASVLVTALNGFASQVSIQTSGPTTGITISPSVATLAPGTPQQLTLSASSSIVISNAIVSITGTSGSLTHTAQLTLSVTPIVTSNVPPFRMRYVRTDATTSYSQWLNSSWIIYNPPTSRFFVTDPDSNHIFVLDAGTETVVGAIKIPGAFGIDDTPDHLTLYVGTQIGDIYAIDPVGMTVTKRYLAARIGPNGFNAYSVRVMADGRLALLGGQGGIPSVDGYGEFAFWNPADNSLSAYYSSQLCGSMMGSIGVFTRTPDRAKVVVASIDSDRTLCEVDEGTATGNYATVASIDSFIWHLAFSPDGKWIALPVSYTQAGVLDAHTLAEVARFNVAGDTSSASGFFVSSDSKTLYTPSSSIVYAYDLSTGLQTAWLPNVVVQPHAGGGAVGPISGPNIQALDGTGLVAGPMEEGVGFLDTTSLHTGSVGTQFLNGYLNPDTGPTVGGTPTTWSVPNSFGPITDIYFGSQKAFSVSGVSASISATTPPGASGPADVYTLVSDGGIQLLPEAFSYGPSVLQITPDAASAEGGTGFIYGYGLGPNASTAIPSDLQVMVGGKAATVAAFNWNAYSSGAAPFPLQSVMFNIPAGVAGSAVDITISTSSGSVTVHGAMTYRSAVLQFSIAGSVLAQGIYDSTRDVYYFTDAGKIQVFSKTSGTWLVPISVSGAQRLWGIALSADGSKLAIADVVGNSIYVLNPDNPATAQEFPVPQAGSGTIRSPVGVAVSNTGIVYFSASTTGGTGYDVYFKLNTSSGQVTAYSVGTNSFQTDKYLRTILRDDNSMVYANDDGAVFTIDTATDKISYAKDNPGCCYGDYELSISGNQARIAATGYLYDSNLNAESYVGLNLRERANTSYLYGEKLSADGRLLFQPTTTGIDVLDGRLGTLLTRIALPITLTPTYDTLVSDGKDNTLIAITGPFGGGIAVIDLNSITEPSPLPYEPNVEVAGPLATARFTSTIGRSNPSLPSGAIPFTGPILYTIPHVKTNPIIQ